MGPAQDVNVLNTVDVNVVGSVAVDEPVDVNVLTIPVVTVAEPVDVNVLGTVPVSGTVSVNQPVTVNGTVGVSGTVPVSGNVGILGTVPVSGTVSVTQPVTVNGTVGISGTVPVSIVDEPVDVNVLTMPTVTTTATLAGSTAATNTITALPTGTGVTVDFLNAKSNVTMMVRVNGVATGGVVALQGSHDNTNWVTLASSGAFATGVNQYLSLTGGAFRWFRGLITENVAGGGNITCTLMFA